MIVAQGLSRRVHKHPKQVLEFREGDALAGIGVVFRGPTRLTAQEVRQVNARLGEWTTWRLTAHHKWRYLLRMVREVWPTIVRDLGASRDPAELTIYQDQRHLDAYRVWLYERVAP